jgi:Zn-finger nucleic acid-binding protein
MDEDVDVFQTPNCPQCLLRLEAGGTVEHTYLACPGCRTVYLHRGMGTAHSLGI